MKFLWQYVLIVAALMAGSLLLAACGGGEEEEAEGSPAATEEAVDEEELDLDQYFRRLEDISDDAQTRMGMLQEEYQEVEEDIEAIRDYVDAIEGITKQALNDLKDLHPPAEARDAHDEFVGGASQMLALWEDRSDRLADVESPSEAWAALAEDSPASDVAAKRTDNACRQLQGIADENGIDVDLECGEEPR